METLSAVQECPVIKPVAQKEVGEEETEMWSI